MLLGKWFEADKDDPLDADGFAFFDIDLQANRLLVVAEARIERSHAHVGIPAVAVVRHDALEVGLELLAREVLLDAPRQPGTLGGRQNRF